MKTELDLGPFKDTHKVWHKFYNYLVKTYGKDLHGEWQYMFPEQFGKKHKYRSFNEEVLHQRLVGYEVLNRVEKYVKRYIPEIEIVRCDDAVYSGSTLFLIPHPKHGISVFYIPQCTSIQNQFFLYESHYKCLLGALERMAFNYRED